MKILIITNEKQPGISEGQIDGYLDLVRSSELDAVQTVSWRTGEDSHQRFKNVRHAVFSDDYNLVIIWSPSAFELNDDQFAELLRGIASRPILYWEGDPWSHRKKVTSHMNRWLAVSEIVFSVGGSPQAELLIAHGAHVVAHIPHTYCHIQFALWEKAWSRGNTSDPHAVLIGGQLMRYPRIGLGGVEGSRDRYRLVTKFRRQLGSNFSVYGKGWPRRFQIAELPYDQQCAVIAQHKFSVNWDHFPAIADYASDRLAISLIAGRPHITTAHPGMEWLPKGIGLIQAHTVPEALECAWSLINSHQSELDDLGQSAYHWVRRRLSHREAARYILSKLLPTVAPPPKDPWAKLPGPWTGDNLDAKHQRRR